MAPPGIIRWLLSAGLLATPLGLAACSADDTPPPNFAPLSFGYLRPLRLNVGTVDVTTNWTAGPGDSSAQSPLLPADVLQQMARERLVPAGASGRAVFTVEQASVANAASSLSGLFRVRVDIYTSDGKRAAYAEAAVARSAPAPDDEDRLRPALYDLTRQMMADMNVELEYQLRRSLGDWLQTGDAVAPPPPPVQQETLAPPGAPAPDPRTPGFRLVPATPP